VSVLDNKHFMIVKRLADEILVEDVSHGYPGIGYYIIRAEGDNASLEIYELKEKEVKE
jgi:hypothetical protein